MATEKALFAAGCFWGVQDSFDGLEGVIETVAGYSGGHTNDPTYGEVCGGETGHAESVLVSFDPSRISYRQLLDVFWSIHDPTTKNRQGPDVGSQYRSAIFYFSGKQKQEAEESLETEQKKLKKQIITGITPAGPFHPAEGYHQHYHKNNPLVSCLAKALKKKKI